MANKKREAPEPRVEIHVQHGAQGAAAGGAASGQLSPEQINAVQVTVTNLITGFSPPPAPASDTGLGLTSLEIELGFTLEASSGGLLKLVLDAKGTASVKAKAVWSLGKG